MTLKPEFKIDLMKLAVGVVATVSNNNKEIDHKGEIEKVYKLMWGLVIQEEIHVDSDKPHTVLKPVSEE